MITLLRYIDNFLGKILSDIFKKPLFFKENKKDNIEIRKILLIKLWGLGNLTVILPLVYKIKEKYFNSSIFFLTFDLNKGFLERNQAIDKIIYFKFTKNIFKIIAQFIFVLATLRKEKIDLVINFETFNNTSALLPYLIRAPLRIGINNKYEKTFYNYWFDNNPSLHISQLFLSLLKPLKMTFSYRYFNFRELIEVRNSVESTLRSYGIEKFICIHPGTSGNFIGKRWRPDNFAELSNMLIKKHNLPLIFTGIGKEKYLIRAIIKKILIKDKVFNLANFLNIGKLIELLRRSILFISNDTGPMHIAASLGINTVVFFGPTTPDRYKPLNENSLIFYKNLKCSPCIGVGYVNGKCKNKFKCLDFSPQEIFSKISEKFFNED